MVVLRLIQQVLVTNFASFVDSTFMVTLKGGSDVIGSYSFNPPNDAAAFSGVKSLETFDTVEITETTGNADNEYFGFFYAGFVKDKIVGGKLASTNVMALLVASLSSISFWMIPTLTGLAGVGVYLVKTKK